MKRMLLLAAIIISTLSLSAITVFLDTGRDYQGDFTEFRDSLAVLNDEGVLIMVPVSRVKAVVDGGKDITADFLAGAKKGSGGDAHFLSESDYFVSETEPLPGTRAEILLGRLNKPATEENEMTAEFIVLPDNKTLLSQNWYKTRPAQPEDIIKNTMVIFFGSINEKGTYRAPADAKEARTGMWFVSYVQNAATKRQGYVTVGSGARVEVGNLRVAAE